MTIERFVGVDLAWADGQDSTPSNETGLAVLDSDGMVIDAGWAQGLDSTLEWIERVTTGADALMFVDAPLVVNNPSGQRLCERQVGQRYGRWQVSANSTNTATPHQAGVKLRERLTAFGWTYQDGFDGPPASGRVVSECYPYTTLVGVTELGYHQDGQRPRYKRKPSTLPATQWRPERAANCDELVRRLLVLERVDPPLRLSSHLVTRDLLTPSPEDDRLYKHREDLIDAVICAWTAALWHRHGLTRCQVLGVPNRDNTPTPTIVAPAVEDQRHDR
jgi:predicted RNase H-like nuclease